MLNADVTDDMASCFFLKGLPNDAKNSFLQMKVAPPFFTRSLHNLCIGGIKSQGTMMATLFASVKLVNFEKTNCSIKRDDFKEQCIYCGLNGHKQNECKGCLFDEDKEIYQNK